MAFCICVVITITLQTKREKCEWKKTFI